MMIKKLSLLAPVLITLSLHGQYKVQFNLKEKTAIHYDSIYITGTFCNWDSMANPQYLMRPVGNNVKTITLNLPAGTIRYKFHRGSWSTVEKQYNGDEVADRVVTISRDTVLTDSVVCWRDQVILDKKYALQQQTEDSSRLKILAALAYNYAFWTEFYNADSALLYANWALQMQQTITRSKEYRSQGGNGQIYTEISLKEIIAVLLHSLGNYPKALEIRLENLELAERTKDRYIMVNAINNIKDDYSSMKDYENVLHYGKMMDSILNTLDTTDPRFAIAKLNTKYTIAKAYYDLNQPNLALYYANIAAGIYTSRAVGDTAFNSLLLGDIYFELGKDEAAFYHYRLSLVNANKIYNPQLAAGDYRGMARLFKKQGRVDSALYYAKLGMGLLQNFQASVRSWGENSNLYLAEISPLVAELYKANGQPDSAYKYLLLSVNLKDSLYNSDKVRQFQTLSFNETVRRQQLEQQSREAKNQYQTRIKIYGLVSIITGFIILALILYRNNKQKQKANALLHKQKNEIERTLDELKNTQKQLIQSEKMASLGELTAGIAHEIQNPLNFVNNFSDINKELVEELKAELETGNLEQATGIANDIKENSEKISHHGKRADSIVKGMLQHSRSSSGRKELTDINALCDEYLRLAYHGLRAKDKSFNAKFETDLDPSVEKISVVPQDIGRVVLNLINNAFYAVSEKKKSYQLSAMSYEPVVTVGTKKINTPSGPGSIRITVKDNGGGIPDSVKEKIFQPFFTTKPTGEGTGLGLSLSYDIITKGHGGELKVNSSKGEGSEFIIILPV